MAAYFQFKLATGNGPFTIKVRESNDPVSKNRYISGTIPNPIEYEDIPDGLPHTYIVEITSPSCDAFSGSFTTTTICRARPAIEATQNCNSFISTGKVFVDFQAALEGYSKVLLQVYDGLNSVIAEEINTSVKVTKELLNNKNYRIKVSNPVYGSCFTEINYSTNCVTSPSCDANFEVEEVNPDTVISTTPAPVITSVVVTNGQAVVSGTAACNGFVRLYRKNTSGGWDAITERNIAVLTNYWTYTFSANGGTYAADAYCSQYTKESLLSAPKDATITPVNPDPEPEPQDVLVRAYLSYNPGDNTFVTAQVTPDTAQAEARLVSTGNSTAWLPLLDWGSVYEGKSYNKRLVVPNLPQGNYTISVRNKNNTDEVQVIPNLALGSTNVTRSLYEAAAPVDPSTPTVPTSGLITGNDVPKQLLVLQNEYYQVGFHLGWGGAVTYLKPSDAPTNLINNMDYGRQIQYAIYGWPTLGFSPQGKQPAAAQWSQIGWDPIQAGDFDTPSVVTQFKLIDSNNLYFRTIPRHWGYRNSPAECYVDTWVKLNGRAIEQTHILHNHRTDAFDNLNRGQDWTGAYIHARWFRAKSYWGNKPYTNAPLTDFDLQDQIPNISESTGDATNLHTKGFYSPEKWMYLYNVDNPSAQGLGMWSKSPRFTTMLIPGGSGYKVDEGEFGSASSFMRTGPDAEMMERNIVYRWDTSYIIGSVEQVRAYAYDRRNVNSGPKWDFTLGKDGWWSNPWQGGAWDTATQTEYPHPGYWEMKYETKYANIVSPDLALEASNFTKMEITMAITGTHTQGSISFNKRRDNAYRYNRDGFTAFDDVTYNFDYIPDGQYRTYTVNLTSNPNWGGIISRIYIDMNGGMQLGRYVRIKSIELKS